MKNRDVRLTFMVLGITHVCLIVLIAMIFGLQHPFQFLYRELFPYAYILAACLMVVPVYMVAGYIFVLGKNQMRSILDSVWKGCSAFIILLVVIWCISYVLTFSGWDISAWTYYVVANYPISFLMNHVDLASIHASNPVYVVPALIPGISFFLGAKLRVREIKGVGTGE